MNDIDLNKRLLQIMSLDENAKNCGCGEEVCITYGKVEEVSDFKKRELEYELRDEDDDYSMPRSKREKEQAKNSATNEFTPDKVYNAMMKRKRVGEADDEVDTGPTWKDDLEDALDGYPEWAHEYIKDGVCPECGGNGYMDGDYENEDGE